MPEKSSEEKLLPTPLEVVDYNFKIPVIRIGIYGRTSLNLKPEQDIYIYEDLDNLQLVLSVYEFKRSMYRSIICFSEIKDFVKIGVELSRKGINILSNSFYKMGDRYRATLLYEVLDSHRLKWKKSGLKKTLEKIHKENAEDKIKELETIEYSEHEKNNERIMNIVVPLIKYHDNYKKKLKTVKISSNWTIYYKIGDDFIERAFPLKEASKKNRYLFSWDEIPTDKIEKEKLIEFLNQQGLEWAKEAEIEKIDNGNAIKVSNKKNSLSLKLNNKKTKVNLEINDRKTDEFIAKAENAKLNIYKNLDVCKCIQIAELEIGILILKFYETDILKINIETLNLPGSFVRLVNICRYLNIEIEAVDLHKISLEGGGSAELIYILKYPDDIKNKIEDKIEIFSWDEIPTDKIEKEKLIEFLNQQGLEWAKEAEIEKIDNGNAIKVSNKKNSLSLKLNNKKDRFSLEIGDSKPKKFRIRFNEINEDKIKNLFRYADSKLKQEDTEHRKIVEMHEKILKKTTEEPIPFIRKIKIL